MQKIVVIGGGYAFDEVYELIKDINNVESKYNIIGILDDNEAIHGQEKEGVPILGGTQLAKGYGKDVNFIFAIGSFRTRLIRHEILKRLDIPFERFETLVHPTVKIFSSAKIGHGCIVHYGTVIFSHTIIEPFAVIAANNVIAVANLIGQGALMGSNITTTTGAKIGCYSFIGSSTSIGEHIEIQPGAYVGMGCLVLKKIKAGAFVLGNPPKILNRETVSEEIIDFWNETKERFKQ